MPEYTDQTTRPWMDGQQRRQHDRFMGKRCNNAGQADLCARQVGICMSCARKEIAERGPEHFGCNLIIPDGCLDDCFVMDVRSGITRFRNASQGIPPYASIPFVPG
ncbi:hypothetical protein INT44_007166 [Umbelopsis vinacea]|uniref:Uncharacterized protein n=1 Tax=Umbelopsis vinacea TaxID=44442 RepID=A0A8H7PH44_9FUNG|nr:hypothetical protein INT44_007166 [Umbelopsis vinacea]